MAEAAQRASKRTTLVIGKVEIEIGLFATRAKPGKLAEFTTAGPNGGQLRAQYLAQPVAPAADEPIEERPVHSDPLADDPRVAPPMQDPGPDRGHEAHDAMAEALGATVDSMRGPGPDVPATVHGEYGRHLVEEGTGQLVEPEQVRKGVRLADGSFIDCTDALEQIVEDTKLERIEVAYFIDAARVPRLWVQDAQYIGATGPKAPRSLRLIYEALKAERRAAIVKYTMRSRQTLAAIVAVDKTLVMFELAWMEDIREVPAAARRMLEADVDEAMVSTARELVTAMSREPKAITEMRDEALARREDLYLGAVAGNQPPVKPPKTKAADEDLMAALEASLAAS